MLRTLKSISKNPNYMKTDRRKFVKTMGAGATGLALGSVA